MPRKSDSKDKMIAAMRQLLQRQGYHGTGLSQVLKESGAPKGSLYFHFPDGKEQLAEAAIGEAQTEIKERFGELLPLLDEPGALLAAVAVQLGRELEESGFEKGCPAATLALETSAYSERLQACCQSHYETYLSLLQQAFEQQGMSPDKARGESLFALSALEGALLLAKTFRNLEPLQATGQRLKDRYSVNKSRD